MVMAASALSHESAQTLWVFIKTLIYHEHSSIYIAALNLLGNRKYINNKRWLINEYILYCEQWISPIFREGLPILLGFILLQFRKSQCLYCSKYRANILNTKTTPVFAFWMSLKVVMTIFRIGHYFRLPV